MKPRNKALLLLLLLTLALLSSSCRSILKLTYQNKDFEWLNANDLARLVIQSTRDKGFRFVVTDELTLVELYKSLSSAMPVEERNSLEADYIFEFRTYDNTVRRFSYIAGSDSQGNRGNFYNDTGTWLVLNRIDTTIFNNLYTLRKPRDFAKGYYGSILDAVKLVQADYQTKAVGVRINEDKEMLKFQMSYEILEFNQGLQELGALPVLDEKGAQLVMTVKTRGFSRDLYKAVVEIRDQGTHKTDTYYLKADYRNEAWQVEVSKERMEGF